MNWFQCWTCRTPTSGLFSVPVPMQDHNERVHSPHICFELWKTHPEPETAWEGHKMILVYYDLLYAPDDAACVCGLLLLLLLLLLLPTSYHCLNSSTHFSLHSFIMQSLLSLCTTTHCEQTVNTLNIPMLVPLIFCFSNSLFLFAPFHHCALLVLSTSFIPGWMRDWHVLCVCVFVWTVFMSVWKVHLALLVHLTNLCYMLVHLCLAVCCACIQAVGRAGAVCGPRVITDTRHEADPLLLSADAPAFFTLAMLTCISKTSKKTNTKTMTKTQQFERHHHTH